MTLAAATKRGFTLVEAAVVVAIVGVVAAAFAPKVSALKRGQDERNFYMGVAGLVMETRNRAIADLKTVELTYDATQTRLVASETDPNGGASTEIDSATLPSSITAAAFRLGSKTVTEPEWKLDFTSDGRTSGGGIQFTAESVDRSVLVNAAGIVSMVDGALPDVAVTTWQAGNIENKQ